MSDPVPSLVGAKVLLRRAREELQVQLEMDPPPKLNLDVTMRALAEAEALCRNVLRVLELHEQGVVPASHYPNGGRAPRRLTPAQWLYAASTKDSEG